MATLRVNCGFVWLLLLLRLLVRLPHADNSRVSMEDDVLQPYGARGHGPAHSHRHVRAILLGNVTHETWRPPPTTNSSSSSSSSTAPPVESTVFVTDVPGSSRWVYGHMTVVADPLGSLSVLEPAGPGGCSLRQRALVEETAAAAGCLWAQNAGFFNTSSGRCLGGVVSDGRAVQDGGGVQNAHFGVRRDGSLVFGYLSQEEVLDQSNPFVQLVGGVVWLLRNGRVYINQSLEVECDQTQETGTLRTFVDVVSARTAVGHDAEGRLVLVQLDGQTRQRGMSLWELADFLQRNGVVNAINLDGGGSSTFVADGSLASYPSDHCVPDSRWRCARRVSTVLCVHPLRCRPADCSGNGGCEGGRCVCRDGWSGSGCEVSACGGAAACGEHGVCGKRGCVCDSGWSGATCSQVCPAGSYGDGCSRACACLNGGSCDPVSGRCSCPPGFHGDTCDQVCPAGSFGPGCSLQCRCHHHCPCDPQTGSCNISLPAAETNDSLHRAGLCLAQQIFSSWRRAAEDEGALRERPRLAEWVWLLLTAVLSVLLLLSLALHLLQWACPRGSASLLRTEPRSYSYVPLNDIHGVAAGESRRRGFVLGDSDSEDEEDPTPGAVASLLGAGTDAL
ncbi:N-acetylglucosamine-1-phosphodiester alpha-N-acetylglucosaminidase isoform X2 [Nelusetta ayraudi]|uniref:N-acetylglucosamine-1-phosphodiester alpha-N-acetylglucosaminidase isoform X2 n=1 Tax=Nelusetta ayraudi TaxID=303726 RepID=UPI003F6EC354